MKRSAHSGHPQQAECGRRRPRCVSAAVDKPRCGMCGVPCCSAGAQAGRFRPRLTPEPEQSQLPCTQPADTASAFGDRIPQMPAGRPD
jgi:hypothetical protein